MHVGSGYEQDTWRILMQIAIFASQIIKHHALCPSAVSYEACACVLRWLRDPPCITWATLRPSPQVKSMNFGLYYDGYEALCVLRSLRNRRHCSQTVTYSNAPWGKCEHSLHIRELGSNVLRFQGAIMTKIKGIIFWVIFLQLFWSRPGAIFRTCSSSTISMDDVEDSYL